MLRRVGPDYAAALDRAGFQRELVGTEGAVDVYRRPVLGRWFVEARQDGGWTGHVDVGLTVDREGGALIGPIHRALSAAALASALPHIVPSLEALARAAESLRCPACASWPVVQDGADGPFLACGNPTSPRKPFQTKVWPCRRYLLMGGVIVHADADSPW
jgi:hypothetical protein